MDNAAVVGVTVATAGLAAGMVGRVLPPMHEIRGTAPELAVAPVREQLGRTGAVVLILGIGASILSRSVWPVVGVVAVCGWLVFEYDTAARTGVPAAGGGPAPTVQRYAT